MRSLQEIYLPILEIVISLCVGLLFIASQQILVTASSETLTLFTEYPELVMVSVIAFTIGYLFYAFASESWKKNILLIANLGIFSSVIWIIIILDRPILLESIFYQNSTRILIGSSFILIGIMLADQKEVQKGGFLIGMLAYLFLNDYLRWSNEDLKWILLFLFVSLFINYLLRTNIVLKNQFLPTRLSRRNYKYFIPLYQSFLILFILIIGTYIYRNLWDFDLLLIIFLSTYTIIRSIAIYKIPEQVHRYGFIYGRQLLTASFILYAASFSWNGLFYPLLLIVAIGLGFYRPSQSNEKFNKLPLLLGLLNLFVLALVIFLSKYNLLFIHLLIILYAIIYLPIQNKTIMNPIDKQAPLIVGMLLSMFLFQIPTKALARSVRTQPSIQIEPIPFYLSNLFDENQIYTFIQSNLPFSSPIEFPTEDEIKGSIPILGFNKDNKYLRYYSIYLTEKKIPHYIIVSESILEQANSSPLLSSMESVSYPGFSIYYYPNSLKPSWSSKLSKDWKFVSIQDKIKTISDWKDQYTLLNQIYTYGGSDMKTEVNTYKKLIHDSILEYCKFFSEQERYNDTIECIDLSLNYGEVDNEIKEISFNAMNYTTPSTKHIRLLKNLSIDSQYKIKSLSKLYPLYESLDDYKNTIDTIGQLKIALLALEKKEELQDLEIDEARYFIKMNKWEEASSSISSNFRKNPDSIVWQRLNDELEKWKESRRQSWTPRIPIETKGIK